MEHNDNSSFYQQTLSRQRALIASQDEQLEHLSNALDRIKNISISLSDELDEQDKQLNKLANMVDKTEMNIRRQAKRADNLAKSRSWWNLFW